MNTPDASTRIREFSSMTELKAACQPPDGYGLFHQPLKARQSFSMGEPPNIDVYVVPDRATASTPEAIPEGSKLVGRVVYDSYGAAMQDQG